MGIINRKNHHQVLKDVFVGKNVKIFNFVNAYGCSIDDNTKIGAFVEIQKGAKIGKNCKISSHTFICEGVTIKDNVFIGHNVSFINDKYPKAVNPDGNLQTEADWQIVKTTVEKNASIGTSATILCGLRIGENAQVGAGAVVTNDVPDGVVVAGNPAKIIKKIDKEVEMNKINLLDLKKQYLGIKGEVSQALLKVCEETAFSDGPFVQKFEKNFANFCGVKYCEGVNSGTSALFLSLRALGIREGDEVIVPANTFIATAWGVSYNSAKPVFVDCDPDTWNIDSQKIEEKITSKTKAIVGVHLYGQPFDIGPVKKIARKHKLFLVEDCAQAHGAKYKEKHVGGFGEMGCFSFYPGKNLGAYGEGGAVVTNAKKYDVHIRSLRNHGSTEKYRHDEIGYNMRMDGFQGAILDIKLKHINIWNRRRKAIAKMYQKGITNPKIKMQFQPEWSDSVYHLFVITTEDRFGLKSHLENNGIFPGMHYPVPCHLQKAYEFLGYKKGDFPNAEYLADHCLSLPMYAELTDQEVNYIIKIINAY